MLAIVHARAFLGVDAPAITIEVHLAAGLPAFSIVGLPEGAVKESKDRVRSAILNSGFEFPARRITVNLAPADLPKEGAGFDLAIALGILRASGQLKADLDDYEFLGELALGGDVRRVPGVLPAAIRAREAKRQLVCPFDNGPEAALVFAEGSLAADHLLSVCQHLKGETALAGVSANTQAAGSRYPDLADVRGQTMARRALEVAAAGGHNLLFIGPPGTGKSMLAHRLPGILPPMTESECLETASVQSVSDRGFDPALWGVRPFRSPHHTTSHVAIIGGGSKPRPGEVSLAHQGVLFLDELPEFSRQALEALREPLETGEISIARAAGRFTYPARFQLIAAMNPSPSSGELWESTPRALQYRQRISGPLLDRFDMVVELDRLPPRVLRDAQPGESSAAVRTRVVAARRAQLQRQNQVNRELAGEALSQHTRLDDAGQRLLDIATDKLGLSARAYHRILRVARSIADLEGRPAIGPEQLGEALNLRRMRLFESQPKVDAGAL